MSPSASADDSFTCPDTAIHLLERLCIDLNRRAWLARMEAGRVCGELDVRMQVMRAGSPVVVEVLGPWAEALTGDSWNAVRIDPWSRVVWRGPARHCSTGDLVRFVEVLLRRDVEHAAATYQPVE